jgi:hydroxymethylbilane synthase
MTVVRIATRRSQLAKAQTLQIIARLKSLRPNLRIEVVEVVTSGDRIQDRLLREVGGKALFVKEIEEAMLDGRADLAVHSLKDLPTELPPGLALLAVPERVDPRDVIVAKDPIDSLDGLPRRARVGTSSLRRGALLLRERPDLAVCPLRGNVDTRLRKLYEGDQLDAIVLAAAGLQRLGRDDVTFLPLDPTRFVAAAGQGALALESPVERPDLAWIADALDHLPSRLAVEAERAFLDIVGGSCQVPVGAYGHFTGKTLHLVGCVAAEEGDVVQLEVVRDVDSQAAAHDLGAELARRVLLAGGRNIVDAYTEAAAAMGFSEKAAETAGTRGEDADEPTAPLGGSPSASSRPLAGGRILVTRSRRQASRLSALLREAGAVPVELPALELCAVEGRERDRLDEALDRLQDFNWVVFTSRNGVRFAMRRLAEQGREAAEVFAACRLASVGTATEEALAEQGLSVDLVPQRFDAEGLLEALTPEVSEGDRVLVLRAREGRPTLIEGLLALGVTVDDVATYVARVPESLTAELGEALESGLDLITFASSKTVANLVRATRVASEGSAAGVDLGDVLRRVPVACIGPITRRTATENGFRVVAQPATFTIEALVDAIVAWYPLGP